ncbi:MAG: histidine kinase [bacterium]|nr:histidine kinase [bacterium]
MRNRVRRILLVSSLYDSFILVEDGQINEAILQQFLDLNLSQNPDLIRVSTGAEALAMAREQKQFDLIITSLKLGDMSAVELARRARDLGLDIPVVLLAYNNRDLTSFIAQNDVSLLDRIFLWQGDVRILLSIVKYAEDRLNVAHDTGKMGVPALIVIEDNVRFYSSFLPVIYTELMQHTRGLIVEGLNLTHKMLRTRARPKILLCDCYEEAWAYFSAYEEQILGIISDIEFPHDGVLQRDAGLALTRRVRERRPDIPIILQSSFPQNKDLADSIDAAFLLKGSSTLLKQLRDILKRNFGFGDFNFQLPDGAEVDRAHDLKSLLKKLRTVPVESLAFHGERNHFSMWLKARTEFRLAEQLRPRKVDDFQSLEHLRENMISAIGEYRLERDRVIVADFDRDNIDPAISMSRIGGGSLGGKARGLAFVNRLLNESDVADKFPGVRITVPSCVVLGTDIFDQFLEQNDLRDFAIDSSADGKVDARFMLASFPEQAMADLRAYLNESRHPLAVRSSGLLEDSPDQPFAGIYQTFMLPNNHPDIESRLVQLIAAVKRVYASTFSQQAKGFLRATPYRLEEEKMAVIIQEIVGARHGNRFYPDFAGVARSYNFYPTPPQSAEDGVVAVALGLGKTVVDGSASLRFCPRYPKNLVQFSSVDDVLRNSQRDFYALDLNSQPTAHGAGSGEIVEGAELVGYGLDVAEKDGPLGRLGSTYSPDNDVVYDGISRPGVRVVSFAPILKHEVFPLAAMLQELLDLGCRGTSCPVEIEFAVNLSVPEGEPPQMGFLQMRPLALSSESERLEIGHVPPAQLICRSSSVLGNGIISDVRDLIVVDFHRFERGDSRDAALQVARFNAELQQEARPYLLIGVGRWGSSDPFLGIPVTWNQISGARAIVEAGFRDFKVTPSQGTHFFQNLTSCNVGYFTVNPEAGDGFLDWDWLAEQPRTGEAHHVRRVRLEDNVLIKMNGHRGEGVILKPGAEMDERVES